MGFNDTANAVLLGNVLAVIFLWSCFQFHRFDYKAPLLAYAGFLIPCLFVLGSVISIEGLPPQFDALRSQQASEAHQTPQEDFVDRR